MNAPEPITDGYFYTLANEPLAALGADTLAEIRQGVETAARALLEALRIDWERDPNTRETPARVARMLVDETQRGRFHPRPKLTVFPNTRQLDELYTVGPITVRSTCSHHLVPILGQAWIGVIPGDTLIGLSKFHRLTEWIMARPQIQEEAAVQLADEIESLIQPLGLGVVVKAEHLCCTWRGVRDGGTQMVTSIMRGALRDSPAARAEFMEAIKGQGYAHA
ncbi:GTP cyclohydrolase I [Lamprobacter modestohalophilus]|uniref:GTP cyclohydrolase I n=1 Tax=Lamprobacter modestohalophilus TaxID=1064514 RepID=UPI002ADED2BD|nr:GTP cyclohydrolase I [Lamprobacter modestohalophilus]MEA1050470.1 GTP cyclohydrolase I [Lamprobacter modestohalophilus]